MNLSHAWFFREATTLDGASKINMEEAQAVISALRKLLVQGDLGAGEVGLVTPYKGQVELLRKMLVNDPMFDGVEVS